MSLNWAKMGAGHVPAYQLSGIPYVTRSVDTEVGTSKAIRHSFPYATRFFSVQNTGANPLRVGFSKLGVEALETHNYFTIDSATTSSIRHELRCKDLFFLGEGGTTGFEIVAGFTGIKSDQFPILTGSIDGVVAFEGIG